jgi:quercetin dioxygenase-like cupin family protein
VEDNGGNMKPYKENKKGNLTERVFKENTDTHELVWHRDKKDREVTVLESDGWMFQMDNELPIVLNEGDVIEIPKNTYHRIMRGNGNLKITIKE